MKTAKTSVELKRSFLLVQLTICHQQQQASRHNFFQCTNTTSALTYASPFWTASTKFSSSLSLISARLQLKPGEMGTCLSSTMFARKLLVTMACILSTVQSHRTSSSRTFRPQPSPCSPRTTPSPSTSSHRSKTCREIQTSLSLLPKVVDIATFYMTHTTSKTRKSTPTSSPR